MLGKKLVKAAAGNAGAESDPDFANTVLLLHGDGNQGATNFSNTGPTKYLAFSDNSDNNFPITVNGDAYGDNFGPYALDDGYWSNYFDGSGDYISVADGSWITLGTNNFTAEAWIYNTVSTGGGQYICGQEASSGIASTVSFEMYLNSSRNLVGGIYVGSQKYATSTATIPLNTWTHVALVRDGGNVRLYINGVQDGLNSTAGTSSVTDQSYNFSIGRPGEYNGLYFNGMVSNFRFVNGTCLYPNGTTFTPSTTPLTAVANTQLLTCQSNRFVDNSANNFTITPAGNVAVKVFNPFDELPDGVNGSGFFDGSGDYLSTSGAALQLANNADDFTIECNVYNLGKTGSQYGMGLVTWYVSTGYGSSRLMLRVNPTTNTINVYLIWLGYTQFGASGVNSTRTATVNAWTHIALVRSSGVFYLYINGVLDTTINSSFNPQDIGFTTFNALEIGRNQDGTQPEFQGYISNARLNKSAVYTSAFTPPTSPLTNVTNTSLLTCQYAGTVRNVGFIDSGPYDFPITRVGNTTQGSFSPFSKPDGRWGNYFDGSANGFVRFTDAGSVLDLSGDFTLEFFAYQNALATLNGTLNMFFSLDTLNRFQCYQDTNSVDVFIDGSLIISYTGTQPAFNTWNHFAITRSGSTVTLYINGTSAATGTSSYSIACSTLMIGGQDRGTSYHGCNAYISNFRVVNGSAIAPPSGGPTSPLTAVSGTSLLTCQSNRFLDNSGNSLSATTVGSTAKVTPFSPFPLTTEYSPSVNGGSGYFDGTGDDVSFPVDSAFTLGTNDFTIEMWLYASTLVNNVSTPFTLEQSSYPRIVWIRASGNLLILASDNGSSFAVNQSIPLTINGWNHVVFQRNSGTFRSFLNGVVVATSTVSMNFPAQRSAGAIGRGDLTSQRWDGWISSARIVNGTAVYSTSGFTPPTAPLTAIANTSLLCNFTNAGIFDNTGFNVLESVGNCQISTTTKKYGTGSLSFDGTGDWLTSPANQDLSFGTGDFTVEGWFNATSLSGQPALLGVGSDAAGLVITFVSSKIYAYFVGAGDVFGSGGATLSTGTWYHFAWVRSGTTNTFYIDGTAYASTYTSGGNHVNGGLGIGQTVVGTVFGAFNGFIDDLRITKGVARYTTTFTPPDKAFPNIGS